MTRVPIVQIGKRKKKTPYRENQLSTITFDVIYGNS